MILPTAPGIRPARGSTRPFPIAVAALTVLVIWTTSSPGAPFLGVFLVLVGLVVAPVLWARHPRRAGNGLHRGWLGLIGLVVVAAAVLAGVSGLPAQARFALSVKGFEAAVADRPAPSSVDPPTSFGNGYPDLPGPCPSLVGLYLITECHTYEGAYIFFQGLSPVSDEAGIAYLPTGIGPQDAHSGFRHLTGPWYTWRQEPMVS